jgi:alkanesulfonate monooxygenase SsuD/methylene tetrahydromethanopterin reductase-like flavin-dependent oxidoreductase (luciferase family)
LAVCVGRDETEARRRALAIGRDLAGLRHDGLAGSPDEVVDKIGQYADVGTSRVYLQVLDLHDLDHLELIASEVMSQLS